MLAYKLGGTSQGPNVKARRFTIIPPQPASDASPETIKLGERLFFTSCMQCHGGAARTSGVISDLRYLSKAGHDAFRKIVLEGMLVDKGMPRFDELYEFPRDPDLRCWFCWSRQGFRSHRASTKAAAEILRSPRHMSIS